MLDDEVAAGVAAEGSGPRALRSRPRRASPNAGQLGLVGVVLSASFVLVEGAEEALRRPGRRHADPGGLRRLPVKSALVQARARLGPEPLQVLFAKAARPLATPDTPGAWYRRWRLLAVDGATLDVADTADNEAAFGRAKSGRGEGTGAFPQVRVVGLVECGTHATIKAAMGSYATGETTLAGRLLGEVEQGGLAGVLLLADRLFVGAKLWRTAAATGAELLWRAKTGKTAPTLPVDQVLADGSWLSRLYAASDRHKRD